MFQQDDIALFKKIMKQIKKNTQKNTAAFNPNLPKNSSKVQHPKKIIVN
jgi:DNA-nicking Smr family endonuclease|tara:strand:- start:171 stop:317 length:147 start_codon:yes stop_codon:yes gene_type:complete